jgi:chemotaxis protein histidine kinase CheA
MQKYFLNDGTGQQGPFSLEELKEKGITAATPLWYDGLESWTTAGEVPELKDILIHTPPPFETVKPVTVESPIVPIVESTPPVINEPVVTVTETPAAATVVAAAEPVASTMKPVATPAAPAPKSGKKSTAWISWAVGVLLLGGTGFYIYQDIDKNKDNKGMAEMQVPTSDTAKTTTPVDGNMTSTTTNTADTASTPTTDPTTTPTTTPATEETTPTTTPTTDPTTTTPTTTATTPTTTVPTTTPGMTDKEKAAAKAKADAAAKAKADAVAKAKADAAAKLKADAAAKAKAADDLKKKQAALAAQAAREAMMRNNWPKYITIGQLNYQANDGVKPFDIPVYNGTDATIDKVTLRVDYMKKEKKLFKSETLTVYNIPTKGGVSVKAPESRKGDKVNVYITSISSKKLHFCYPQNNGNAVDPYFCQ